MSNFEDRVEKSLEQVHGKLDIISEKVNSQAIELGKNNIILDEHQRRTLANEAQVKVLTETLHVQKEQLKKEFSDTLKDKLKSISIIIMLTGAILTGAGKLGILELLAKLIGSS